MRRPPDLKNRGVFSREVRGDILVYGVLIGGFTLASFSIVLYGVYAGAIGQDCNESGINCWPVERARSTAFATLAFLLLANAIDCRHSTEYVWERSLLQNRRLLFAVLGCAATIVMGIYIPFVNSVIFRQAAISWEWVCPAVSVILYEALVQVYKAMKKTCLQNLLGIARIRTMDEIITHHHRDASEIVPNVDGSLPALTPAPVAQPILETATITSV